MTCWERDARQLNLGNKSVLLGAQISAGEKSCRFQVVIQGAQSCNSAGWRFSCRDPDPSPDHEGGVSSSDCFPLPGYMYFLAVQEKKNIYFLQEGIDLGVFPGPRFKAVAMTEVIQL